MLSAPEPLPGLVVRDAAGRVARIVEVTDATPEELRDPRGQHGRLPASTPSCCWKALGAGRRRERAGRDLPHRRRRDRACATGSRVEALRLDDADEALGVNTRAELARAAAVHAPPQREAR